MKATALEQVMRDRGWIKGPDGNYRRPTKGTIAPVVAWHPKPFKATGASTMEERLNKTEKRWLAVLRQNHHECNIGIQDVTLRLGFDLRYTPDFRTVTAGCNVIFWEVKGAYEREDAKVKIKMAAAMFPYWTFIKAVWKDGVWTETVVRP